MNHFIGLFLSFIMPKDQTNLILQQKICIKTLHRKFINYFYLLFNKNLGPFSKHNKLLFPLDGISPWNLLFYKEENFNWNFKNGEKGESEEESKCSANVGQHVSKCHLKNQSKDIYVLYKHIWKLMNRFQFLSTDV